jgi:glycosyltransferase involved in cell wall biosynthesis
LPTVTSPAATPTRRRPAKAVRKATEKPYVTVVLPCFNEEEHVHLELDRILATMDASDYAYELLAIDDKSTDGTLEVLRRYEQAHPAVRVMAFPRNSGSGTARRIGTRDARGEIVVWTDADMTYPNERIPEFVKMLDDDESYDQVVGARRTEEGTYKFIRVPAKWTIRQVAQILTGVKIPDLNSGLRAFRREVSLPYLRLLPPGFSCVTTLTVSFLSNNHDIRYVPIEYGKRAGKSKFKFVRDAYRYILQVLRMVMYFNPIKVLLPIALFLLTLGAGKAVYDVIAHPVRIAINTLLLLVTGLLVASVALLADLVVRSRPDAFD